MLDDMPMLLYILIVGQFCRYAMLDFTLVLIFLVELLRVNLDDVMTKLIYCHDTHVRLSWLQEVYEECCVH